MFVDETDDAICSEVVKIEFKMKIKKFAFLSNVPRLALLYANRTT